MYKLLCFVTVCLLCLATAFGQSKPSETAERSHVERFSTPEVKAERAEAEASAKLKTNPSDAEALNQRSVARMQLGHYSSALEDLKRAVSLNPGDANYWANLGYVLWKLGQPPEAIKAEREAIRLDEKSYTGHYQLGRFLLRSDSKQVAEATNHLKRALEIDPRQYEVRFELIAAYRVTGDLAPAMAQYDLLQDARPSDPRVIYVGALLSADRSDMNSAITSFREALRRDPNLYGAWQDLGLAYMKLNRWPDAEESFGELARRQEGSVEGAYFHALALYNTGKAAAAEAEVRRALRLDAGATEAHILLGIILASRGNANVEATEALSQAIALDPNSFDASFYLGRVQYATKDFAGAAKSLRNAVRLDPRHAEARFFLGTVLEAGGESEAALDQYDLLARSNPQSAMGQLGLGALLLKQGKRDEAIAVLQRAIELDPKNFEAHWALGRALLLSQRFTEAVENLKSAVLLAPYRSDAHYQLGLALQRLGRAEDAAREFAIVDQLNTEFRTNKSPN